MTKKKKKFPELSEKLARPWCYYCERDFDDLKILISHQKAKHFKCDRCGRRLNTAGGLSVHMNQVHKETLTQVENALPGRQGLDIEIFGMEGVPESVVETHRDLVTARHFDDEAVRLQLTGNPKGGAKEGSARKRIKIREPLEEIDERAVQWRTDRRNGVARPPPPPAFEEVIAPIPANLPPAPEAAPSFPATAPPAGLPPPPFLPGQFPPPGALPSRPGFTPPQANPFPPANSLPQQIDDLIASATASAGVGAGPEPAPEKEKKAKKGRDVKMLFFDESVSPEEKMAALPRFADFMRT